MMRRIRGVFRVERHLCNCKSRVCQCDMLRKVVWERMNAFAKVQVGRSDCSLWTFIEFHFMSLLLAIVDSQY